MPGLDQPSSRNPTAALPLVGRYPYVTCTPCGERGATGWGASVRWKNGVAEMVSSVRRTPQGTVCAPHTCLLCYGHACVSFAAPRLVTTRFDPFVTLPTHLGVDQV